MLTRGHLLECCRARIFHLQPPARANQRARTKRGGSPRAFRGQRTGLVAQRRALQPRRGRPRSVPCRWGAVGVRSNGPTNLEQNDAEDVAEEVLANQGKPAGTI